MKILKWLAIALITLLIIAGFSTYWYLNSSKPEYQGELILPGLKDQATVYYDNFGIPHIYANNEEDLFLALGYVHAQDRLFQNGTT